MSDFRHKSRFYPFHSDLFARLEQHELCLKGIKILYQSHKAIFPYGYLPQADCDAIAVHVLKQDSSPRIGMPPWFREPMGQWDLA
ncbi:MAG: hypothetical protein JNL80_11425 [Phycisphaerae bacterium]|nr:hypothetical protein [Phycisphaerae bacterium]